MNVKGKRMLVVGLGESGQAAANLLVLKGATVIAIDESKEITMKRRARRKKNDHLHMHLGVKTPPTGRFDAAILSPGIDPRHGLGLNIMNLDIPVYGELELGSWFCQCPIIAITGTNGKTTTTELIEKVIRANRKKTLSAGNIGLPLSEAALKSSQLHYLVAEVSSFQLEAIDSFHPLVSVLMNITPDHLDRYTSMKDYAATKAAIWKNQCGNDVAVVNIDTERKLTAMGLTSPVRTIRYSLREEPTDLWFDGECIRGPIVENARLEARLDQTRLRGAHNAENIMAALAVAHALDLNLKKAWKTICDYQPLPHRLELIRSFQDVEFVNDSKATNVDAMEKAIAAFNRPIILIAGGKDKGFEFDSLAPLIRKRVKACILIGEMRDKIFSAWKDSTECTFAETLPEAVQMAARLGKKGDVVLLSPGCSSYDMFKNYEERGEVFRQAVRELKSK